MIQIWEVTLSMESGTEVSEQRIEGGHFKQAQAEVRAIKAAQARGEQGVRCTFSRFLREEK